LQAADALDVTQEAFVAVLANVQAYHRDRAGDTFRGWLWTITRNKVHDNLRGQQCQPRAEGGSTAQQQLNLVPDRTLGPAVEEDDNSLEHRATELVRSGVEERTWEAFWLVTVENRKAADVAQQLGLSLQAVYDAKYHVRLRIRRELEGMFD
jgi:RNA polymerase sigma-70 factor (ECF subfamily)